MEDVKRLTNTYFGMVAKVGIVLIILASFFLFTNLFTEFYDTPKFLILLIVTGILLILITFRFTLFNRTTFVRTPLDVPLLLLLAVGIVSTVFSPAPYVSLLGNQLKLHGSLISLIVYVLFYFVLTNTLKSTRVINQLLFIATASAALLSVITLLSYFGVKLLPAPWVHGINFTPTGSSFSTTAILAMLVPIVTSQLLNSSTPLFLTTNSLLLTLFGVTIALTGTYVTQIAAILGVALIVIQSPLRQIHHLTQLKPIKLVFLAAPVVVVAVILFLSLVPPVGGVKNPLHQQFTNFPKGANLGFITSWKIAVSSFRDSPFWGSGPGTFLFNFTNYKPIEFNNTKNWNLRFDSAFNEYLQVLATLGGVGLIALLSLTALFISSSYRSLQNPLAISGLLFFILLVLHASTLSLWVFGLVILAAFFAAHLEGEETQLHFRGVPGRLLRMSGEETVRVDALPSVLLTVFLGLTLFTFFFAGKYVVADFHHRQALNALSQNNGILAYNELVAAEKLNPVADLYRIDLAQTNFALANAIALAKGPTEASPAGFLTDQDKQNIQVLLQQSINEGKTATTLNPKSAQNWEVLGLLYRQIAGVAQNALVFSLDAYGRAIFQDPLNPNLRLNVGGVYYAVKNYDLAVRFFTDAINLKPDFANGYYNLAVALKDKGDLNTAQAATEKVLTLVDKDSQDYKITNDFLTELKNRRESEVKPPAAQTTGALQEEQLPKVVDVGTPPAKIATPSAIKKPTATPEPSPTP